MIKGVDTFIEYLEEERQKIKRPSIKFMAISSNIANPKFADLETKVTDRELEIDFILKRITMSDDSYLKHMEIFYHFKDLSRYIEEANLSYRETFNLVMFMIGRNIKCINLVKETMAINDTELRKHKFPNISYEEIDDLVTRGEVNRVITSSDEELTPREIEIRDAIFENRDKFFSDVQELINRHRAIKSHYFDKLESYTELDIRNVIDNLRALTFSDKICDMVKYILDKQLSSRKKDMVENSLTARHLYATPNKDREPDISYKEQRDIYNKIREYYNIPKKEVLKNVDYDEMLEIVSLMLKINIDLKTIRSYIRKVIIKLETDSTPSTKYQVFKSKLAYYLSKDQMAYLEELYDAFVDDNSLWMEEFGTYLEELMNFVSETDTYTYELETAKQLMKVENGK